jgi:hypothetical protein
VSYLEAHPLARAPLDVEFTEFDPRSFLDRRTGELADFLEQSTRQLTLAKHADAPSALRDRSYPSIQSPLPVGLDPARPDASCVIRVSDGSTPWEAYRPG